MYTVGIHVSWQPNTKHYNAMVTESLMECFSIQIGIYRNEMLLTSTGQRIYLGPNVWHLKWRKCIFLDFCFWYFILLYLQFCTLSLWTYFLIWSFFASLMSSYCPWNLKFSFILYGLIFIFCKFFIEIWHKIPVIAKKWNMNNMSYCRLL